MKKYYEYEDYIEYLEDMKIICDRNNIKIDIQEIKKKVENKIFNLNKYNFNELIILLLTADRIELYFIYDKALRKFYNKRYREWLLVNYE